MDDRQIRFDDGAEYGLGGNCDPGPHDHNDGRMPKGGPETVLAVLSRFMDGVSAGNVDLSRTFTNTFVDRAKSG